MATLLTIDQLTETQRRRGILALMCGTFFSWVGFFMVIPLVAVYYVDHLGWAAGTVGLVLAVRQFSQQALTTVFGILADRVGPRGLFSLGMLTRAAGFAAMGFAESITWVVAAALIVGLGGSMFESPKSAAVATLTHPEERRRYYASVGTISGVGTAVGTQIGAILIGYNFTHVCLVAAGAYVIVALLLFLVLPPVAVADGSASAWSGIRKVMADRLFLRYVVILAGYLFASTQFGLTMTLAAVEITGSDRAVSWIYLVNSVVTIALGYALPRFLERWFPPLQLQIVGIVTVGLGLMVIGVSSGFLGVLVAAANFAVGSVMARPGQETILANLASPSARGTYFGFSASALAIGGGLGNVLGGVIYDAGGRAESPVPWMIFGGVAMMSALLLWSNRTSFSVVRS